MELMRQIEHDQVRPWSDLRPFTGPMIEAKDCEPPLLSGWTDRDISVWDISEDGGKPGLTKILVALCLNKKEQWEKIGFIVFSDEAVSSAGLQLTQSTGKTSDNEIDQSRTHFEIKGITGKEVCILIHMVVTRGNFRTGFFKKRELDRILLESYKQSHVIPPEMKAITQYAQGVSVPSGTQVPAQIPPAELGHPQPVVAREGRLPRASADTKQTDVGSETP